MCPPAPALETDTSARAIRSVASVVRDRVARHIREQGLITRAETVVLAVSGGADSLCLLHVLYALAPALDTHLHVAHLDHGLRGAAGAADRAGRGAGATAAGRLPPPDRSLLCAAGAGAEGRREQPRPGVPPQPRPPPAIAAPA